MREVLSVTVSTYMCRLTRSYSEQERGILGGCLIKQISFPSLKQKESKRSRQSCHFHSNEIRLAVSDIWRD